MQRKQFLGAVLLIGSLSLAGALYLLLISNESAGQSVSQDVFSKSSKEAEVIIKRVDDGYEPSAIEITKGETVLWVNESDEFHWPASNVHPTHTLYSEFDSLKPIAPGDSWTFTFTKVGEWHFHDHLRANKGGVVFVVE